MNTMRPKLLTREVIPFFASLAALAIAALFADAVLHLLNLVWIGRYLGIVGVLLIFASLRYSLRKRKIISTGDLPTLLLWHEYLAWAGSLLILVHAGIHFNSILAWLAVWAMLINVASGLTGKFLLARAGKRMNESRQAMLRQGMTEDVLEEQIHVDTMTFDVVKQWRAVHLPITLAFGVLSLAHIVAVFLFWGWK